MTNLGHTKKDVEYLKKAELKNKASNNSSAYGAFGDKLKKKTASDAAHNWKKQAILDKMHAGATPISSWSLEDYMEHTSVYRGSGLIQDPSYTPDNRDTDVTIQVCIDLYPSEGSWDIWDYQNNLYLLGF